MNKQTKIRYYTILLNTYKLVSAGKERVQWNLSQ